MDEFFPSVEEIAEQRERHEEARRRDAEVRRREKEEEQRQTDAWAATRRGTNLAVVYEFLAKAKALGVHPPSGGFGWPVLGTYLDPGPPPAWRKEKFIPRSGVEPSGVALMPVDLELNCPLVEPEDLRSALAAHLVPRAGQEATASAVMTSRTFRCQRCGLTGSGSRRRCPRCASDL